MNDALAIRVAELSLVEGIRRSSPPESTWTEIPRGTLFVLVELSAPAELWDEVSALLVKTAVNGVLEANGSDSLALNRAAEAVNRTLQQENEGLPPEDKIWAGLNMVLLRAGTTELYLAHAGPGLTYLAREGRYKRFPPPSNDGTDSLEEIVPLGEEGQAQVRLARFSLEPGDVVVLSATHLPQLISDEGEMRRSISHDDVEEIADALAALAAGYDYSALILQTASTGETQRQVAVSPEEEPARERPPKPARQDKEKRADVSRLQPPSRQDTPSPRTRRPPQRSRRRRIQASQPTESHAVEKEASTRSGPSAGRRAAQRLHLLLQSGWDHVGRVREQASLEPIRRMLAVTVGLLLLLLVMILRLLEWTLHSYSRSVLPAVRRLVPMLDYFALLLLALVIEGGRRVLAILWHLLPGDTATGVGNTDWSTKLPSPSKEGRLLFPLLALLLPLFVLIGTGGWYWRTASAKSAEMVALLDEAETAIVQAESANREAALSALEGVEEQLAEAERISPNSAEVQNLRDRYNTILDRVAKVHRAEATLLAPLSEETNPTDIAFFEDRLYILDRTVGTIYSVDPTTPQTSPIDLSEQPLLGPGRPVEGRIQHITRMPPGGSRTTPALIGITETDAVQYIPNRDPRRLQLAMVNGTIIDIHHYAGNLYLLDRQNRQIWKYVPDTAGEYSQTPTEWISEETQASLGSPVSFAIDGDIYLLEESGVVVKMTVGDRQDFALEPAMPAIRTPVALATDEEAPDVPYKYLYIAEPNRILVYDKSGSLAVQYRPAGGQEWGQIRDLVADESNGTIYMLTSRGVFELALVTSP